MEFEKRVIRLEEIVKLLIKKVGISENEIFCALSKRDAEAAIKGEITIATPV